MDNQKNNAMVCDLETGVCGVSDSSEEIEMINFNKPEKEVTLYYVTDPICSHCWAIEPTLRRFIKQYEDYFIFQPVMGGLLEKWHDGPIDPANGIYKPADVAPHWREVGNHSRMPIDGSVMIDNPVQSSYPASRVFKIIQKKYKEETALEFLRRTREALFLFNKNVSDRNILIEIVNKLDLPGEAIIQEAEQPIGQQLLKEDFQQVANLGARGFPTIIMINKENQGVRIVGDRPLEYYLKGLKQVMGNEDIQPKSQPSLSQLLEMEKLLFSKEIEMMYDIEQEDVDTFVNKELANGQYQKETILGEDYIAKI